MKFGIETHVGHNMFLRVQPRPHPKGAGTPAFQKNWDPLPTTKWCYLQQLNLVR